jgi:hypothetical protein
MENWLVRKKNIILFFIPPTNARFTLLINVLQSLLQPWTFRNKKQKETREGEQTSCQGIKKLKKQAAVVYPYFLHTPCHIGTHSGAHIEVVGSIFPTRIGNIVPTHMSLTAFLCICRKYTSCTFLENIIDRANITVKWSFILVFVTLQTSYVVNVWELFLHFLTDKAIMTT